MKTTLFVSGFNPRLRAKNLAYEFERYGRLARLDIPAPKSYTSKPFAFVEFEENRDAEDALVELHGRNIDGFLFNVQWARTPSQLHERRMKYQNSYNNNHAINRSRSPYRRERSTSPTNRGRSPPPPPRYAKEEFARIRSRSRSPVSQANNPNNYHGGRHRSLSRSPE